LTVVLLISCVALLPTAAWADGPVAGKLICEFGNNGTGTNSYVDIKLWDKDHWNAPLPGWCVNEHLSITVSTPYNIQMYDYFGEYYPGNVGLPEKLKPNLNGNPNWFGIAYVLNHKEVPAVGSVAAHVASPDAIQAALWYFSDGDTDFACFTPSHGSFTTYETHPPQVLPQDRLDALALVTAANLYLTNPANRGVFVPQNGDITPIICYVNNSTQPLYFEYKIGSGPIPPLPELPAGVLLGLGLVGLGGAGWFGYRKSRTAAV
jgi:hypothetical protein